MSATVTALTANGAFVHFDGTACDGFIPIESIKNDWYEVNENYTQLVGERSGGTITLGDVVMTVVRDVKGASASDYSPPQRIESLAASSPRVVPTLREPERLGGGRNRLHSPRLLR